MGPFTASDEEVMALIRQYWVPLGKYTTARAKAAWACLASRGHLAAWERADPVDPNVRCRPGVKGSGQIETDLVKEMPYMGHVGGDFVFRCSRGMWMQYEGQVPVGNTERLRRLREDLLPDIYEMAVALLSFRPDTDSRDLEVPPELARIREERGFVDGRGLNRLLDIWTVKFFSETAEGELVAGIRPVKAFPGLSTEAAMDKFAETASIVRTLQKANVNGGIEWHRLSMLLERLSGCSFVDLLMNHDRRMQEQGLRILREEGLESPQVVVYSVWEVPVKWVPQSVAVLLGPRSYSQPELTYRDPLRNSHFHNFYRDVDLERGNPQAGNHARSLDLPPAHGNTQGSPITAQLARRDSPTASETSTDEPIRSSPFSASPDSSEPRSDTSSTKKPPSTSSRVRKVGDKGVCVPKGGIRKTRSAQTRRSPPARDSVKRFFRT
ncbi:hypothetical protein QBC34DRAFT_375603 [Podospora aff. communis PSN243]|uniref:Uncharacterized protein n=1 Tax=Podospora aff. communis PSN243 TaxID=3040156 RepID=A0AAV9H385_9PEZI|nr:hypothetical protein QBC34DRAFT_375603 [Podospora aff. communis PSN243]